MNHLWIKLIFLVGTTCLMVQGDISAQLLQDTSSLIGRINMEALQGRVRSLRDLATLVDKPETSKLARESLKDLTVFDQDLDLDKASKQQLLDYYYQNIDSFRFSSLLRMYYRVPLEHQQTDYELIGLDAYQLSDRSMHLRKYISYVDQAEKYNSVLDLQNLVEKIADLHLLEGQAFLLSLLDRDAGQILAKEPDAFLHYLDQVLARPSVEVADLLFRATDKGYLKAGTLAHYLSLLCNVPFRASWTKDQHVVRYERLLDSLGSLSRVRDYGYSSSLNFSKKHFNEPVDYFGRILSISDVATYVKHNATIDLLETRHPRALFYISTQLLAARRGWETAHKAVYYLYLLRKQTMLGVAVPDSKGNMVYQLDVAGDQTAWLNYVRYYASRYEDYDFDEHRQTFINRFDHSLETENLERLFRLLNSENDEVALQAYERIARADPVEVEQLVNKYKDLLRSTNPKVPPLKNGYLEQTAQLTAFCVRNRMKFIPDEELNRKLDSLLLDLSPLGRIKLENRLIQSLKIDQLTSVEYWALIHQYDLEAGFSIGRVLDYSYSVNWDELLKHDNELRLYLKKAALFARMEGIGISDGYIRKFDRLSQNLIDKFEELLLSEGDKQVSRTMRRILNNELVLNTEFSEVDEFLERPEHFTKEEIEGLPQPSLRQLDHLFWRLQNASAKANYLYNIYLEQKITLDFVPELMSLIIRNEFPDEVAKLLGTIYHYQFDPKDGSLHQQWLAFWQQYNNTYRDWGKAFYQREVERVKTSEKVNGGDLASILSSPYYEDSDREFVLGSLKKLISNRHLFMLRFEPPLRWPEREVLSDLNLSYKDLQELDKLFPDVPSSELIDYILTEAKEFSNEDRGRLFNALMRKPWMEELLDNSHFAYRAGEISKALEHYLEESEFLSEYEEQNTTLNLARLKFIGKSSTERLRMSIDLKVDEAAKLRIQESILSRVSYSELPQVMALIPKLAEVNGTKPYNFVNADFGLPIFNLESASVLDTFTNRHARLTEKELYALYLKEFGLRLELGNGNLNYFAIAQILRYDIVLPFIGGGGNRRDFYTYGVIKLLEFTEGTRLGFHEKLNENQLFYSYSASRRASAWLDYLKERKLIPENSALSHPSFNVSSSN